MKAGKLVKSLGMAAVALTLVSACMVGSTLAKYTTTVGGTGTATVAMWSPTFNGKTAAENAFSVALADTSNNGTVKGVAPGTKGSFEVVVASNGTQTDFDYSVTLSKFVNKPENLKFYTFNESGTKVEAEVIDSQNNVLKLGAGKMTAGATVDQTITVEWEWPYGGEGVTDAAPASADMRFDITCTATQSAAPAA